MHKYGLNVDPPLHSSVKSTAVWTAAGESCPKLRKMQTSADKVLASVFWDTLGILFLNYLENGRTVHSKYYIELLVSLKEEIIKKQPQMKKKKFSFTKTMHCFTNRSQRWQNYINCISNCFHTHSILQIWPSETTGCLQT